METNQEEIIFLEDLSILPFGNCQDCQESAPQIIRPLGYEEFYLQIADQFSVFAGSHKYLAKIANTNQKIKDDEILYSGNIVIYKGLEVKRHGLIWTARENSQDFSKEGGLTKLLFGADNVSEECQQEKIQAILRGYEKQLKISTDHQYNDFVSKVFDSQKNPTSLVK